MKPSSEPCNHCKCIEDCKKKCMKSEYCNAFVIHKVSGGNSECEFRNCNTTLISIPTIENYGEGYYITNGTCKRFILSIFCIFD